MIGPVTAFPSSHLCQVNNRGILQDDALDVKCTIPEFLSLDTRSSQTEQAQTRSRRLSTLIGGRNLP
jgi:hypothetical protein